MEGIIPGWCYQGPCTLSLPAPLAPNGSNHPTAIQYPWLLAPRAESTIVSLAYMVSIFPLAHCAPQPLDHARYTLWLYMK